MVQWLGLCAPNAGDPGSIPGQGARFHMPQLNILHLAAGTWHRPKKKKSQIGVLLLYVFSSMSPKDVMGMFCSGLPLEKTLTT